MAITVKKLFKNGIALYNMNLLAGQEGLNNLVQWVHIIEDAEVGLLLHGNELVFTAGILNKEPDWLINFAKNLYKAGASAFVVNIGPYTKNIPKEVIDFCNEVNMPLFTIPWKTKMVDMTRDFCHRIMHNDTVEDNVATTIKNIIFRTGDLQTQISQMERYGYKRDSYFCFLAIAFENESDTNYEDKRQNLKEFAEKAARSINELYLSFSYIGYRIIVLVDYSNEDTKLLVQNLTQSKAIKSNEMKIRIGIGSNMQGLETQDINFEKALSAMELAIKKKEKLVYYNDLNFYKILLSVRDKSLLREYYQTTIGPLENYDHENGTDLVGFLKTYLENNASPQLVSEKLYIHRNTVNNQLKKIEKITGYNPYDLEDKVKLYIAYNIQDIL